MRRLVLPAALLLLCGCTLFESPAERAQRNSPDFKAGYRDGCASAGPRGADPLADGIMRDEDAYRSNRAYHAGWGTGFNACRTYQPGNGQAGQDRGPIPDPNPGALP